MKKNFLFGLLAIWLASFWFGGVSMANTVDCNTGDPVAGTTIGGADTCYDSLQDAINNAEDNGTVILKKNTPWSLTLNTVKTITLNMNENKITWSSNVLTMSNGWKITIEWNWSMELTNDWDVIKVTNWECVIENWTFKGWTVVYADGDNAIATINNWSFDGTSVWNRTAIHATNGATINIHWWNFIATVTGETEGSNKNLKVLYAWWNFNRCSTPGKTESDYKWWTINVDWGTFYGRLSKSNLWTYNIKWWTFRVTEVAWVNCDYDTPTGVCNGGKPSSGWCEFWTINDQQI